MSGKTERFSWSLHLLLHLYDLNCPSKVVLGKGACLELFQASKAKQLFRYLADRKGVDPEDESGIRAIITVEDVDGLLMIDHDLVHSILIPSLAVALGVPPVVIYFIFHGADQIYPTAHSFYHSRQFNGLYEVTPHPERAFYPHHEKYLKFYYQLLSKSIHNNNGPKRIVRAMELLGDACASRTVENAILSISTAMEVLLAPQSQGEVTHQIAVNGAWLLAESKDSRPSYFQKIKSFYSIRSKIVHGGVDIDGDDMDNELKSGYELLTKMFRRICDDQSQVDFLFDEKKRKDRLPKIALGLL